MAKKPIIPFSMTPASWGLKGVSRQIAEAEYNYSGEDLERRLAEIHQTGPELARAIAAIDLKYRHIDEYNYDMRMLEIDGLKDDPRAVLTVGLNHHKTNQYDYDHAIAKMDFKKGSRELKIAQLDIDLKHDKINQYEHDVAIARFDNSDEKELARALLEVDHYHNLISSLDYEMKVAEMEPEGAQRDLAVLKIKYRFNQIDEYQYEKEVANINEAPWIRVINSGFDPEQGPSGVFFEFDWNEFMILYLRMNGYTALTEAAIIDAWFNDLCREQGIGASTGNPYEVVPFGRL